MAGLTLSIDGIEEIKQALQELSKGIGDRALLELNKETAKIAKKALQQSAPAQRLRRAKTITVGRIRGSRDKTAVGVGYNRRGFLARFYEKGGYDRKTRKGYKRGNFSKRPFVKRTFESVLPQMSTFISGNAKKIIIKSLQKYSNRLSKRLAK